MASTTVDILKAFNTDAKVPLISDEQKQMLNVGDKTYTKFSNKDGDDTVEWPKIQRATSTLRNAMIVSGVLCLASVLVCMLIVRLVPNTFSRITQTDYTEWNGVDSYSTVYAPIINTPILFVLGIGLILPGIGFLVFSLVLYKHYIEKLLNFQYDHNWQCLLGFLYPIIAVCIFMILGVTSFSTLTFIALLVWFVCDQTATGPLWFSHSLKSKHSYMKWRPFMRGFMVTAGLFALAMVYLIETATINWPILPGWYLAITIVALIWPMCHGAARAYTMSYMIQMMKQQSMSLVMEKNKLPAIHRRIYWLAIIDLIIMMCLLVVVVVCACCSVIAPLPPFTFVW